MRISRGSVTPHPKEAGTQRPTVLTFWDPLRTSIRFDLERLNWLNSGAGVIHGVSHASIPRGGRAGPQRTKTRSSADADN